MKIKRKIPVLEALLKQALYRRFPQIKGYCMEKYNFHLCLHSDTDLLKFSEELAFYVKHLLDEFGEPGKDYTFHLNQDDIVKYRLLYTEVNNISAIAV